MARWNIFIYLQKSTRVNYVWFLWSKYLATAETEKELECREIYVDELIIDLNLEILDKSQSSDSRESLVESTYSYLLIWIKSLVNNILDTT